MFRTPRVKECLWHLVSPLARRHSQPSRHEHAAVLKEGRHTIRCSPALSDLRKLWQIDDYGQVSCRRKGVPRSLFHPLEPLCLSDSETATEAGHFATYLLVLCSRLVADIGPPIHYQAACSFVGSCSYVGFASKV